MIDSISFFVGGMILGGLMTKILAKLAQVKVVKKNETEYDRVLRLIREKKIIVKLENNDCVLNLYTKDGKKIYGWHGNKTTIGNWGEKDIWPYSPLLKIKPNGTHLKDLKQASLPSLDEIEGVEFVDHDDFLAREIMELEKRKQTSQ